MGSALGRVGLTAARSALLAACMLVALTGLACGGDDVSEEGATAEACWSVDATSSDGDTGDAESDRALNWVASGVASGLTPAVGAFLGRYQSGLETLGGVAADDFKQQLRDADDTLEQWKVALVEAICDLDEPAGGAALPATPALDARAGAARR